MFEKLSREDLRYFLVNARKDISYLLDILEDEDALNLLTYLHYEPAKFQKIRSFFNTVNKDRLSGYITNLWDFGILEFDDKKNIFQLSKLGNKLLELLVQLVFEALLSHETSDPKMQKILIQRISEKELNQLKKEREENRAKGIQIGTFRGP